MIEAVKKLAGIAVGVVLLPFVVAFLLPVVFSLLMWIVIVAVLTPPISLITGDSWKQTFCEGVMEF